MQLFNAVQKQQKNTEQQLKAVGSSVRKRDKVLEGVDKGKFLDVLKGSTANVVAEGEVEANKKQVNIQYLNRFSYFKKKTCMPRHYKLHIIY